MTDLRSRLPTYVPAAVVAVIVVVAMARILTEHWRQGGVLLGGALLVAAVLRIVVPNERAGLLAVRSRAIDVLCYGGLGLTMVLLAVTITRSQLSLS